MAHRIFPSERSILLQTHERGRDEKVAALTIDELQDGLQTLQHAGMDRRDFREANGPAFRETVLLAIRETSEALLFHQMSSAVRSELESQLDWLEAYLDPQPRTLN